MQLTPYPPTLYPNGCENFIFAWVLFIEKVVVHLSGNTATNKNTKR